MKPKRGRPPTITREILVDALNRRLTRKELAEETGIKYDTIQKGCLREGIYLPSTPRGRESVTELVILFAILKYVLAGLPYSQERVAQILGVHKQRVSAVVVKARENGVEL